METREAGPNPPPPFARLDEAQKQQLRSEDYAFISSRRVRLPEFPDKEFECTWKLTRHAGTGAPVDATIELKDPKDQSVIGEIQFAATDGPDGAYWNHYHRFVPNKVRGKGVGSYLMRTGDAFAVEIVRTFPGSPTTIKLASAMPSVIELGLKNGYTVPEDERIRWGTFVAERDDPANKVAWEEKGELPSFQRAFIEFIQEDGMLDSLVRDDIILIRENIPSEETLKNPQRFALGYFKHQTSLWDEGIGPVSTLPILRKRYGGPELPFVMTIHLTKSLDV